MPEIPAGHITVNEAVRVSAYSRNYLYILIRDKKIESVKYRFGRMSFFLVDKRSLTDFMQKQGRTVDAKEL